VLAHAAAEVTTWIETASAVILLANSGSRGKGDVESGEVAAAVSVKGMAVPPGVEADELSATAEYACSI
jgi:hypothetical protein